MQERKLGYLPLLLACALALSLVPLLLSAAPVHAQAGAPWKPAPPAVTVRASETVTSYVYLPLVINNFPEPVACDPILGIQFGTLSTTYTTNPDVENSPDYNIYLRGWEWTDAHRGLVFYQDNDDRAPQFRTLFGDRRTPTFSNVYRVYDWDLDTNTRGDLLSTWPVTMLGMQVEPAEIIHVPDSGYDIQYGYDVLVLYATENQITLKYTRVDHPGNPIEPHKGGYKVHVEGICVEPSLLAHYEALDAAGRSHLPTLKGGWAFGRAWDDEIRVSITDCGSFMDPRSQGDWWDVQ
jgi:hypothetical protein